MRSTRRTSNRWPKPCSGPSVEQGTPLREDVVVPCDVRDVALAVAPDPAPPYFRVPKVIER